MTVQILQGDCRAVLATLEAGSVQMCVTSPPYWGLRDYGVDGQIGLESTVDAYVDALVAVFQEVRRVLSDDGTVWLNLGDAYANDTKWGGSSGGKNYTSAAGGYAGQRERRQTGLKPKDLIGLPWIVAFALRADGWYLRSDIVWAKPNCMPESVTDRPTRSHEYIFLLSKRERYFYDADAIREPASYFRPAGPNSRDDNDRDPRHGTRKQDAIEQRRYNGFNDRWKDKPIDGRNKRSVWTVATTPYPGAHFATFPEKLIEPCILAGSSPRACEMCRAPWERRVERVSTWQDRKANGATAGNVGVSDSYQNGVHGEGMSHDLGPSEVRFLGWQPTCQCPNEGTGRCVILDPFFGSGTTGRVATRFGRDCIGIELNPDYISQAERRTDGVQLEAAL
jgi:DNA modification methylase